MDLIDPLDDNDKDDMEEKHLIDDIKSNPLDSDEEQTSVEHLAPQTLLETPDADVQYALRSPEGSMITYRVLQVQDSLDSPDFVSTGSSFSNSSTIPQVISGSNLNGPIYVIGNADAYSSSSGSRPIAPRPTVLDNSVVVHVKKRDEKRRATHNEVERRRRDKINNWIAKLAKILPDNPQEAHKGNGQYDGHSKGGILAKAFEYIIELQATETRLGSCLKENKKLANAVDQLRAKNYALESENSELRELLEKHGLEISRPS